MGTYLHPESSRSNFERYSFKLPVQCKRLAKEVEQLAY